MKAVITAGGRVAGAFAQEAGTSVKALAPVRGAPMLAAIIDALRECGVTRIALVGGDEARQAFGTRVERFVDESPSGAQNMLRALQAWPDDDEPLLYATSDLPYAGTAAVRDFIERAAPEALGVALVEHADYVARFPGAPPAGITLAGQRVVNGGLFSIPRGACGQIAAVATQFFDARKKPWRMASLVSPLVLVEFFFGRLSIARLESVASRALRVPSRAVRGCAPELAFDVDGVVEYRYACAHG